MTKQDKNNQQKQSQENQERQDHTVQENQDFGEQEIDLRELIEVLLKRKWLIAGIMAVAVFLAGIFTLLIREPYVATILDMEFDEIEQGEYPSGEAFSTSDIISPYVLSRVVEDLELDRYDLGVRELREVLEVEELYYPVDDDDEETEPAHQYQLTIYEHEDIEMSTQLKRQIISRVIDVYQQEYTSEFIERPPFPRLTEDHEEFLDMDYPFIARNLRSYQGMFQDHIEELLEEADDEEEFAETPIDEFYSSTYGMSFHDLLRDLESLEETQYQDISAAIRTNALSKDPERAITRYSQMIDELEREEEKKQREADHVRELLGDADQLRTGDLPSMFPSVIEEGDHDLLGEIYDKLYADNFYPQLLEVSLEAADDSIDKKYEIQRLERDIERMEAAKAAKNSDDVEDNSVDNLDNNDNLEDDNEGNNPGSGMDLEELKEQVDTDISRLVADLNRLVNIHNNMMEEYYEERAREGISYARMPFAGTEGGNLQLNVALGAVLGLMIGVFGSFFHEFWTRTDRNKKE
ncbi:Wzz/FepE/Etk N-terminal domain-containing protein [Natranaerobius thermophilus]|uniref:Lipopolysaccharide biosynthesis protein n=1 Tax=Natranaerobius thermophilus (strain ATCC BAA-1301 / DSM 18059 / JW/NM-WN-LF) TaxID=457570 RepID=B2A1C4_NATTJ|nr:Wzz/FepE/Etk N-terminal domain-containing protein [Natranaerobius thermophilus]ACB86062.1 lipopolysaccharide biosynthesis protein [Natranaerobius thermophilus JW/NM-WN-LF]